MKRYKKRNNNINQFLHELWKRVSVESKSFLEVKLWAEVELGWLLCKIMVMGKYLVAANEHEITLCWLLHKASGGELLSSKTVWAFT